MYLKQNTNQFLAQNVQLFRLNWAPVQQWSQHIFHRVIFIFNIREQFTPNQNRIEWNTVFFPTKTEIVIIIINALKMSESELKTTTLRIRNSTEISSIADSNWCSIGLTEEKNSIQYIPVDTTNRIQKAKQVEKKSMWMFLLLFCKCTTSWWPILYFKLYCYALFCFVFLLFLSPSHVKVIVRTKLQ